MTGAAACHGWHVAGLGRPGLPGPLIACQPEWSAIFDCVQASESREPFCSRFQCSNLLELLGSWHGQPQFAEKSILDLK
jgi:hypothetical protein